MALLANTTSTSAIIASITWKAGAINECNLNFILRVETDTEVRGKKPGLSPSIKLILHCSYWLQIMSIIPKSLL